MKKLLLFAFILILAGCTHTETEMSEVMHEKAKVITLLYSPSEHKTELTKTNQYSINHDDDDIIGTDWDGNTGLRVSDNYQITSTTIPEKYGVVFQCQHSTFTIEGSDKKYKILHDKLRNNVNDTVDILYKEQFLVTYKKNENTGKEEVASRVLQRYDFVDAQALNK